jgi:hypothetical protein
MEHPYKSAPRKAFWKRGVTDGFDASELVEGRLLCKGDKVASAGSCFAANIVPYITRAGFEYVQTERLPGIFGEAGADNFSYSKFSAAYGNIYTPRQALQLLQRALGEFAPLEDYWQPAADVVVDPFRPGLKFPASSIEEFAVIRAQHLRATLKALEQADVFVFTLGLTESWYSRADGAVFPACPGTIAGSFDPGQHAFHNFSVSEVIADTAEFIRVARGVNPRLRFVLTVSPVPLVATAAGGHVLTATVYSKSVLRVAAQEIADSLPDVVYFPAYEIVTGPQAPEDSFQADRREPSQSAIDRVMRAFLGACETDFKLPPEARRQPPLFGEAPVAAQAVAPPVNPLTAMGAYIASALCEEAAQND